MKLKYLYFIGLAVAGLTSCNDYLDVDAPSKYDYDYVYSGENEISTALNGVYAQLLNGNTYGSSYLTTFCMNSDVDFSTNSNEQPTNNGYRRFECTSDASNLRSTWNAVYQGIDYANTFIYQLERSALYTEENENFANLQQMMGEAKCIRAMLYHDLMWLWGDVPFSFTPTAERTDYVTPVMSRDSINDLLIADLESIAPKMKFAGELDNGVERCSREFAWAMIARIALTEGGYSLRPDKTNNSHGTMERPVNYKDYYAKAHQYCDSVIQSGKHSLAKTFEDVFVDECNYIVDNDDDPIFEIPFAKNASGSIGYIQGPRGNLYEGSTSGLNIWGGASASAQVSTFYRYSFDSLDVRRSYLDGMWYYLFDGTPTPNFTYTMYNNKWSKFWSTGAPLGATNDGNTGINYPYMRYADVLLMDAEALNEINGGPTDQAIEDLKTVRRRAFKTADQGEKVDAYISQASGSKEDFLNAVLNERKWEFAGENMRWKDLVRNNRYNQALFYTFLHYYSVAQNSSGTSPYEDAVADYDGTNIVEKWPYSVYYRVISNPGDKTVYPNTTLDILEVANPYFSTQRPGTDPSNPWQQADVYGWWNESTGVPTAQCLYSLYGFIRGDEVGNIYLIDGNGTQVLVSIPSAIVQPSELPVVRYILPYPRDVIQRGAGAYKNYYGYLN